MNNLDVLWAYTRMHGAEGIEGDIPQEGRFRDLKQYHQHKIAQWEEVATTREINNINDLIKSPLEICNIRDDGNELSQPDASSKIAVAAMLLAMSIVLNLKYATLERAKAILDRLPAHEINARLRSVLTKGDLVESILYPRLQLKNFKSVSLGYETVESSYSASAESAYGVALDLLNRMHGEFVSSKSLPPRLENKFGEYFGPPDAVRDVNLLGFRGGCGLSGKQSAYDVVRAVLGRLWPTVEKRRVRLYYGGGTIVPNVVAYTNMKSRDEGRINVHLAIGFFSDHNVTRDIFSTSRAGIVIHELTHALAGTIDVGQAFTPGQCRTLARNSPQSALVNAQNYASFTEEAYG